MMDEAKLDAENQLELPEMPELPLAGTRLVHRAVSISVVVMGVAVVAAVVVIFTVKIIVTVTANGVLEPSGLQLIHSPASGIVSRVLANTGEFVKNGQLVVQLDSTSIKESIRDLLAEAALKQAEYERTRESLEVQEREQAESAIQATAQLLKAKAYFRKSVADYQKVGSPDSILGSYEVGQHVGLDVAYADVLSAEAEIRSSQQKKRALALDRQQLGERLISLRQVRSQILSSRQRLSRLNITSPSDGIIITDQLDRLMGTSVREGDLLFQVADLTCWQAALSVGENDVHEIKIGSQAKVEVIALSSLHVEMLKGSVQSVALEPMSIGQKTGIDLNNRYRVLVRLKQEEIEALGSALLKPGYTVVGKITTNEGAILKILLNSLRKGGAAS